MSKAILEKKILEETKDLSFETLNEILDFIQFLKSKKQKMAELDQTSLFHLEKEFENYKEIYPHLQCCDAKHSK